MPANAELERVIGQASHAVGRLLRERRVERRLSQAAVAAQMKNWRQSTVNRVEHGERRLSIDEVAVLAGLGYFTIAEAEEVSRAALQSFRRVGIAMPADLALVAEIYQEAADAGEAPVVAVAETFGIPRSTANKRVIAARKVGLLAPTRQGVAPIKRQRCPTCGADPSRWRLSLNDSSEAAR